MKKSIFILAFCFSLLLGAGVSAFAQNTTNVETQVTEVNTSEPTGQDWLNVISNISASIPKAQENVATKAVVIAMGLVQVLLLVARSAFAKLSAAAKYWTVGGLSLAAAILTELLMAPAINLQAVLTACFAAPVVAAFSVLMHQGIKLNVNEKA